MPKNQTKNGFNLDECWQALTIYLRRGVELKALEIVHELIESGHVDEIWKFLIEFTIAEIGPGDFNALNDVLKAYENRVYFITLELMSFCIIRICRAGKSREVADLYTALQDNIKNGIPPVIPEAAVNIHTERGKKELSKQAKKEKKPIAEIAREKFVQDWGRCNIPVHEVNSAGENHSLNLWTKYGLAQDFYNLWEQPLIDALPYRSKNLDKNAEIQTLGHGIYEIESSTQKGKKYTVDIHNMTCTCKAFQHGKGQHCKHIMRVIEEIRGEQDEPKGA